MLTLKINNDFIWTIKVKIKIISKHISIESQLLPSPIPFGTDLFACKTINSSL